MNNAYLSLIIVLLMVVPCRAQQPPLNLPELEEWYSWPGGKSSHISYLPGFSANGGMNAITQWRDGDPTWFNQFAYDTVNRFSWKEGGSKVVVQIDFNNDGIFDYFDTGGRIYTSQIKGEQPNPEPVAVTSVGGSGLSVIGDINKDGYPDLLLARSPLETSVGLDIVYGGLDLTHLRVVRAITSEPLGSLIAMYFNENQGLRMITYYSNPSSEAFILYGLTFKASTGDSVIVGTTILDRIVESRLSKDQGIFSAYSTCFYESKALKKDILITTKSGGSTQGYNISADKFGSVLSAPIGTLSYSALKGSIDGDSIEDFIIAGSIKNNNISTDVYFLVSGNPLENPFPPKAYFRWPDCGISENLAYIGDVTGDGIGDVAYGSDGCFIIYKGIDWRELSASDAPTTPDFTLHQSEPSPIGKDGMAVLPITLAHAGVYTLDVYDLTGKRIGEMFHGELPSGEVRLPLDVKSYNLSSGMFALRLTDGKHTRERAIVIQR